MNWWRASAWGPAMLAYDAELLRLTFAALIELARQNIAADLADGRGHSPELRQACRVLMEAARSTGFEAELGGAITRVALWQEQRSRDLAR